MSDACRSPVPAPLTVVPAAEDASFVGRQPIYDRRQRVYGYELLWRPARLADACDRSDSASTARVVLDTFLEIGLDVVVGPHRAFINATREFLLEGLAFQLPPGRVVIEVLESVEPDAVILDALRDLRRAGYLVALDDFTYRPALRELLDCADLVKIDITAVPPLQQFDQVRRFSAAGLRVVAECVETPREFSRCRSLGFQFFQGYFLARPTVLQTRRRSASATTALRLLAMLENPALTFEELEAAVSTDPTLSYRLLRVINSAAFALHQRVDSLRQALVLLGLSRIRDWVVLMVLAGLSDKPPELVATALVRGRMCERLALVTEQVQPAAAFTVGLFSTLDALLEAPLSTLVENLPLSAETVAGLVERRGALGRLLAATLAYEQCCWAELEADGWSSAVLRSAYLEALAWARRYSGELDADAA